MLLFSLVVVLSRRNKRKFI